MAEKVNEYKVAGYSFLNTKDYNEAKREAESIDYIRTNTDLADSSKVLKLYNKLLDQKTMKTVVGYGFLKELQDAIIKQGVISEDNLPKICIEAKSNYIKQNLGNIADPDYNVQDVEGKEVEKLRNKYRNSRIINVFLCLIIIAMILINLFDYHGL